MKASLEKISTYVEKLVTLLKVTFTSIKNQINLTELLKESETATNLFSERI